MEKMIPIRSLKNLVVSPDWKTEKRVSRRVDFQDRRNPRKSHLQKAGKAHQQILRVPRQ